MNNWNQHTKAIVALVAVLFPLLNNLGVPLPAWLTVDYVEAAMLALTPFVVWYFANAPAPNRLARTLDNTIDLGGGRPRDY